MKRIEVSRRSIPKDFIAFYEAAKEAGWRVFAGGNSHLQWRAPGGGTVYTSMSPSCASAKKVRADLRRAGLDV